MYVANVGMYCGLLIKIKIRVMKKLKQPLSIQVIYWFTQIVFWMFVVVFFASFGISIAMFTGMLGDDLQLHTGLPVEVNYTEAGVLDLGMDQQEVEFVEAIGKIYYINTNPEIAKWFAGVLLGIVCISLYIFIMIKRFIGNVYRGFVFERFNIRMLKNIAYGLVVFWAYINIYSRIYYYAVAKNLEFEHLEITGQFNSYSVILIVALFLWVLSHIFMRGVRLQEEQQLTV